MCRGSRKHVLDLLDCENYIHTMNGLLAGVATITAADLHHPQSHEEMVEWTLPRFIEAHQTNWPNANFGAFHEWWPLYKMPTWDLISTCTINNQVGILLVEAKAHVNELRSARFGKSLAANANAQQMLNHEAIGNCIAQAQASLVVTFPTISLSRDSHYQLSNRVASAWKIASCGVPVALVYLGFLNDNEMPRPFQNAAHWQTEMMGHTANVLPVDFQNQAILCNNLSTMKLVIRSLSINDIAPAANAPDIEPIPIPPQPIQAAGEIPPDLIENQEIEWRPGCTTLWDFCGQVRSQASLRLCFLCGNANRPAFGPVGIFPQDYDWLNEYLHEDESILFSWGQDSPCVDEITQRMWIHAPSVEDYCQAHFFTGAPGPNPRRQQRLNWFQGWTVE